MSRLPYIPLLTILTSPGATLLIRELGGPGEGPGELGTAAAMAVMPDGRVVLSDLGRRGYHLFGADREFDRMVRMPGPASLTRVGFIRAQPGATAIVSVPSQATDVVTRGAYAVILPSSHAIERTILSGEVSETDTIAEAWMPPTGIEDLPEEQQRILAQNPFVLLPELSPEVHWGVLPDGSIAFADSTTWTVRIAEAGSGVVRILKRPFQPEPVTGRIIRAERDRRLRRLEETNRQARVDKHDPMS